MTRYIRIFTNKFPRLTIAQIKTLVDISVNVGTLGIGSVFVPLFLARESSLIQMFGLAIGLSFWYIAIRISKKII